MNSKDFIIHSLRENIKERFSRPEIKIPHVVYPDKLKQFIEISAGVGGRAEVLNEGESIDDAVRRLFPDASRIACNLPEVTCATYNPDDIKTPAELNGTDLVICRGIFGVCENAAVYFEQEYLQRGIYFISEALLMLLPKDQLVDTMHDAYQRVPNEHPGEFRGFMSGPSKTADIEQSLVMGAHGPRQVTVLLI
ncbi:LUD domain-containing protein [Tannerella sp.]|uniref:LutC/YkgG family protein n=1 Tax=Tannerella sp. TaxID=2382127 RepID=UPI0026DB49C6|nr:LUD domain-containing protein [Tannerella sp.]MDO4703161.1 LUD domain-containing protein [Tannerella sp.]